MINIIPIIIDERGSVKKDIQILAMEGESKSKGFSILLPNSIIDKWLYIEFEKANGDKFVSARLRATGNYLNYDITNQLTVVGKLVCQVVAKNGDSVIWKSNKFDFTIPSSINATEELVEASPDIIAGLQQQIDDIESGEVDLTNYYTKEETYSKEEVDTIISEIPTTDLSNYYTKEEVDNKISEIPTTDLTNYYNKDETNSLLNGKQDTLVSGENIKTINGESILGNGNIAISGGSSAIPIENISGANITIQPNKHYVISGVSNSLTITLSEPITSELKHYSFEFSSIDRIPKVTINGVELPYKYEFGKYIKYVCEIVNNSLVILGEYDGYPFSFVYGLYSSSDYTTSYNLKDDRTFVEVISGVTKNGTYKVELSGSSYLGTLTYEDSSIKIFTYNDGTITIDGVVYTKLS